MKLKGSEINFLFTTDWHVTNKWPISRIDDYLDAIFEKIDCVLRMATEYNATILHGGDWVDKYTTKPALVNLLLEKLSAFSHITGNGVYSIIGNHDIYGHNSDVISEVTIGSLFASGVVKLLHPSGEWFVTEGNLCVQLTGVNYFSKMDRDRGIYRVRKDPSATHSIHVVHGFLSPKHYDNLKREQYQLISDITDTEADVICTGHEHQGYGIIESHGVIYTNPGSLGRVSASLNELKRMPCVTLLTVSEEGIKARIIPVPAARPGNEVLSRERIEEAKEREAKVLDFKANLSDERAIQSIEEIMDIKANLRRIPESVRDVSIRAMSEYERSLS